jgi:hypothetical protein
MGQEQAAKHCRLLFSDAVWNGGIDRLMCHAVRGIADALVNAAWDYISP